MKNYEEIGTVNEAVDTIIAELAPPDVEEIKKQKHVEDLYKYHHGFGTWIRNSFGLWKDNKALLADCKKVAMANKEIEFSEYDGVMHPDDASFVIITELWKTVHGSPRG